MAVQIILGEAALFCVVLKICWIHLCETVIYDLSVFGPFDYILKNAKRNFKPQVE